MNNNLILLSYLITNKKSKLFNFNNYHWKLICILDFNNYYSNIRSKIFNTEYKLLFDFQNLITELKLDCSIYKINKIDIIDIKSEYLKIIPIKINNLINLKQILDY
jgi:hypothetical protein